jgi:hypothetical protein
MIDLAQEQHASIAGDAPTASFFNATVKYPG